MTKKIHKYEIGEEGHTPMPAGAALLCVNWQPKLISAITRQVEPVLFVWASVDPEAKLVERRPVIKPTGAEMPADPYVGTIILPPNQGMVFHVFDGGETEIEAPTEPT